MTNAASASASIFSRTGGRRSRIGSSAIALAQDDSSQLYRRSGTRIHSETSNLPYRHAGNQQNAADRTAAADPDSRNDFERLAGDLGDRYQPDVGTSRLYHLRANGGKFEGKIHESLLRTFQHAPDQRARCSES